jgi:hypothetical protein
MKILTSGCSFSRGPTAWPNHVANLADADLVNLAQAGAGNTYISRSIIDELQNRTYDLVLVMWSGLERIDIQVSNIQQFSETIYTSDYQSKQNDWPEKIVYPVNDQDYVQKNWVFGVGHLNKDTALLKSKLFDNLYRYQDFDEHLQRSLYDMISLESYLKANSVPYVFSFYQNYITPRFDCLDWDNIFNEDNIFDLTKTINEYDADGLHPGARAQEEWANCLYRFLKNSKQL